MFHVTGLSAETIQTGLVDAATGQRIKSSFFFGAQSGSTPTRWDNSSFVCIRDVWGHSDASGIVSLHAGRASASSLGRVDLDQLFWGFSAYAPGYCTIQTQNYAGSVEGPVGFFSVPRSDPNAEYRLRYLIGLAHQFMRGGCDGDNHGEHADDERNRFKAAMIGEAQLLAKSEYERFLFEELKAVLTSSESHANKPKIDIYVIWPPYNIGKISWQDDRVLVQGAQSKLLGTAGGRVTIFCSNGVNEQCDINTRRANGNTLLMEYIQSDHVVEGLLNAGADPSIENSATGENALSLLIRGAHFPEIPYGSDWQLPSSMLHTLRLLSADSRTRVTPKTRAELKSAEGWKIDKRGVREFLEEAQARVQSLPDSEDVVHACKDDILQLPDGRPAYSL